MAPPGIAGVAHDLSVHVAHRRKGGTLVHCASSDYTPLVFHAAQSRMLADGKGKHAHCVSVGACLPLLHHRSSHPMHTGAHPLTLFFALRSASACRRVSTTGRCPSQAAQMRAVLSSCETGGGRRMSSHRVADRDVRRPLAPHTADPGDGSLTPRSAPVCCLYPYVCVLWPMCE